MGAKEYGPTGFLQADTLRMAMEEVIDLANYARYTYIRLALLKEGFQEEQEISTGVMPPEGGFVSTKESWKNG